MIATSIELDVATVAAAVPLFKQVPGVTPEEFYVDLRLKGYAVLGFIVLENCIYPFIHDVDEGAEQSVLATEWLSSRFGVHHKVIESWVDKIISEGITGIDGWNRKD